MQDLKPPLTYDEATQLVAETAKEPRVTKESIESKIATVDYLKHGLTTIAVITLKNGFKLIGHSTPASPGNYSEVVGQAYAYDNAFRQAWQLEGYLLRSILSDQLTFPVLP